MFPGARLLLILVILTVVAGCYKENPVSDFDTEVLDTDFPTILEVSPDNGASGVIRNSNLSVRFDSPMDTASVSNNFHLSGGDKMQQWMDSMSNLPDMNGMGQQHRDSMMTWMDSIEYTGDFEWNDDLDSCVFYPDSMLEANAEHMIFLDYGIKSVDGYYIITDTLEYNAATYHFTTGSQ